jgi:hypothetical protein
MKTSIPLEIEWAVHKYVHMLVNNLEMVRDCWAIDNGITFPDPTVGNELGKCLTQDGNNTWMCLPQARLTKLPSRTRKHLESIDLVSFVASIKTEANSFKELAGAANAHCCSMTEDQLKLVFLSTRVLQVGARLDKTCFEMAVVKDGAGWVENGQNGSPMADLYEKHFAGKSLSEVNTRELDLDIEQVFQEVNNRYGTYENGFEKLPWKRVAGTPMVGVLKNPTLDQSRFNAQRR